MFIVSGLEYQSGDTLHLGGYAQSNDRTQTEFKVRGGAHDGHIVTWASRALRMEMIDSVRCSCGGVCQVTVSRYNHSDMEIARIVSAMVGYHLGIPHPERAYFRGGLNGVSVLDHTCPTLLD